MDILVFKAFSREYRNITEELSKEAAVLTQAARKEIAPKNFALTKKQSTTGKRAYPIEDESHARNALVRVRQHGTAEQQAEVYKDVARKYPHLASRSSIPELRARTKQKQAAGIFQRVGKALASEAGTHKAELAGLGILAAPSLDQAQAHARAALSGNYNKENVKKREFLPHVAHPAAEVAGLGVLAGPSIAHLVKGH